MELTTSERRVVVPARSGRAVRVARGERVRVVDVAGGQVGDVFAFTTPDAGQHQLSEHHSASHTRAHTNRVFPAVGEDFVTNHPRPILRLVADDSPGRHDLLIAACDAERYAALGAPDHSSCAQNLRLAHHRRVRGYRRKTVAWKDCRTVLPRYGFF